MTSTKHALYCHTLGPLFLRFLNLQFPPSLHPSDSYLLIKTQFKRYLLREAFLDPTSEKIPLPHILKALWPGGTSFLEGPCSALVTCVSESSARPVAT